MFYTSYKEKIPSRVMLETVSGSVFKGILYVNRGGRAFLKVNTYEIMNLFLLDGPTLFDMTYVSRGRFKIRVHLDDISDRRRPMRNQALCIEMQFP